MTTPRRNLRDLEVSALGLGCMGMSGFYEEPRQGDLARRASLRHRQRLDSLAQGGDVVPIPGTKRRRYLEENTASVEITLTDDDMSAIAQAAPVGAAAGNRYADMSAVGR